MQRHQELDTRQPESGFRHSSFVTRHFPLCLAFAAFLAANANAADVARFVEYIETDGVGSTPGEYILLDYTPTSNSVVEADVAILTLDKTHTIFCSRASASSRLFTCFYVSKEGFRWDYNTTQNKSGKKLSAAGERHLIRCSRDGFEYDGTPAKDTTPADFVPGNQMTLFASYNNQAAPTTPTPNDNFAKMRLYSFKAWDDGGATLKVDLRPCVDTDGDAALYDCVTGRLYYNINASTSFTPSPTTVAPPAPFADLAVVVAQTNGGWYATADLLQGNGDVELLVVSALGTTNVVALSDGPVSAPATFTVAIPGLADDTAYALSARTADGLFISTEAIIFTGSLSVEATTAVATTATPGAFTVSRASTSAATGLPLTVNISLSGTAVAGTHYAPFPTIVTIPAGAASATVQVTALQKVTAETALTLALSDGNYLVGDPSSATVSITTAYAEKVVRVAPGGTGDGSSWASPMGNVANAYASAAAFVEGGGGSGEVWIKTGRYTITAAIAPKSHVAVRGGFLGTETDASQARRENLTILSGDKTDDDYWMPCGTNTAEKIYVWTGEDKMTFNPPNPDGSDEYWSYSYGASEYSYGFQTTTIGGALTNCVFSGLTFSGFYYRAIEFNAGGPHSKIAVTNCSFLASGINSDCGAYIYADDMTVSDNLCWGGRSGIRLSTTPSRICTNEIARCTFRDIYSRGGMYLNSGLAGTQWRITDCDFFRNRSDSNGWAPSVIFGGNKGGNFYMTRCTIRECRISSTARGLAFCQDGGAGQIHFFTDCDISDNISTNCSVGCGCFSGSHIGKNWFFRNCSIRNNTTWHTGSGNAASVYVSIGANQYTAFLNCSIVGNRIVKVGETPAASHGTLSIPLNTTRLAVVNCLLDGNECVGAVTNADIVSCHSGNMAMAVVNSVITGEGDGYKAIHTVQKPYLLNSYLAGFDRDDAGCTGFERCENVFSTVDPAICEQLRSKTGAPHRIKGLWVDSPYWRGGVDVYWRDRGTSRPHVVLRDPVFHGGKNPWHPINYGYGENNFSDATAEAEGLTVDSPLVPDAIGNRRKAGKVALGPIGFAQPAVMTVR